MTGVLIRSAGAEDVAAMCAIYAPVVRDTAISFEEQVPTEAEMTARLGRVQESYPWLVADIDGDVAGYAYGSSFRGRRGYRFTTEVTVYVSERFQRRGIARRLMERLLDELPRPDTTRRWR